MGWGILCTHWGTEAIAGLFGPARTPRLTMTSVPPLVDDAGHADMLIMSRSLY